MANISETELRIRLRKLESYHDTTGALVKRVGDQYEYTDDYIYTAYASALANLSAGKITSQQDATNFQFSPYNTAGILLAYRGFFINRSIYQSGDPTDYTWESTSGQSGYTSSERYYTTSTGLVENLGNPINPGSGVTWTVITAGTAVPGTAVWIAERFTIDGVPSIWSIYPVSAYIGSGQIVDSAVIADKIATNAVTTAKILNDAIDADKIANNAVTTAAILNDAIDSDKIAANAVTTTEIAANTIVANNIQANAIGANEIAANSLTAGQIATNAITADEIQAGAIGVSELAANSVTADAIAANAVTASEIAAGTITASEIAADAILANKIKAGEIEAGHLKITGTNSIGAGTIGAASTFYQTSAPTATAIGDIWIDTDDGNRQYRASATGSSNWVSVRDATIATAQTAANTAVANAATAQGTADGKVTTFFATSAPTAEGTGDLWMDTDDGNKLYRWSSSAWVAVQDGAIATAISNASTAQSTADGKIVTFYQDAAPAATSVGDMWVDTNDGNRLYRASATGTGNWVNVRDTTIATAQSAASTAITNAATAQGTADGKVNTYFQDAAPTGLVDADAGDLWIDTNDGNKLYRWNITPNPSVWEEIQDDAIATAISDAATAQSTADGKIVSFYQDGIPTSGVKSGDLWIDTNDGNKLYRAGTDGSNEITTNEWETVQDTSIAVAQTTANTGVTNAATATTNAATAQTTADSKVKTYNQNNMPDFDEGIHYP